jgi:Holliday junction resolvase RusA-like endonuclease
MTNLSPDLTTATGKPARAPRVFTFGIDGRAPGKPRMTQRDKWKKRPCVVAYRAWADRLREAAPKDLPIAEYVERLVVRATYAPPKSWSRKKQAEHIGQMMRTKPDGDNVLKSVCDALWIDDHKLGDKGVQRRWAWGDGIEIQVFEVGADLTSGVNGVPQ